MVVVFGTTLFIALLLLSSLAMCCFQLTLYFDPRRAAAVGGHRARGGDRPTANGAAEAGRPRYHAAKIVSRKPQASIFASRRVTNKITEGGALSVLNLVAVLLQYVHMRNIRILYFTFSM